ncbi:hypothetical protein ACOY6I_22910, partial [Enterobacter hormaechei]
MTLADTFRAVALVRLARITLPYNFYWPATVSLIGVAETMRLLRNKVTDAEIAEVGLKTIVTGYYVR